MAISELAQYQRRTTGDVPAATMGTTATAIGNRIYVIAGRLVSTKQMTLDVYRFDLSSCHWKKLSVDTTNSPPARYFHTAAAYGQSIVIHGGMGNLEGAEALCVLGDVLLFDTKKETWTTCYSPEQATATDLQPRPRYAHLSVVSGNKLVILGGQDIQNDYLEDAALYDLELHTWTGIHPLTKQCGAYRSVAVNVQLQPDAAYPKDSTTELNAAEIFETRITTSPVSSRESWPNRSKVPGNGLDPEVPLSDVASTVDPSIKPMTPLEKHDRVPSSIPVETDYLCLYSNFSFLDVQRELHLLGIVKNDFHIIADQSASLKGPELPPGLRFPSASVIGTHMLISGTYLSDASQSFNIWTMCLETYQWNKLDLDALLTAGSWNKGIYLEAAESYVVLGNRDRSLLEDYNKRQVNCDHVIVLNTRAFGLSSPTGVNMSPMARDLGLLAMNDFAFADTDLITLDGTVIPVLSKIVISKWPGFIDIIGTAMNSGRPLSAVIAEPTHESTIADRVAAISSAQDQANTSMLLNYVTTRPRCFYMPYPHTLVQAFVHFLYTDQLPTSTLTSVDQLCALLLFKATIDDRGTNPCLYRLRKLCKDCLHRLLSSENARKVYEVGVLTGQRGLQIRAMQTLSANQTDSSGAAKKEAKPEQQKQEAVQQPVLAVDGLNEEQAHVTTDLETNDVLDGEVNSVRRNMSALTV